MTNIKAPKVIYLQLFEDEDGAKIDPEEATWCDERISKSDIKYVLSTALTQAKAEARGEVAEVAVKLLSNKPPCSKDNPCGCHFGEVFHADGKCACDLVKDLFSHLTKLSKKG